MCYSASMRKESHIHIEQKKLFLLFGIHVQIKFMCVFFIANFSFKSMKYYLPSWPQVEFLCERGADVNRGQRSSSLHYAACFGRPQVAKVTPPVKLIIKIITLQMLMGRFTQLKTLMQINEHVYDTLKFRKFSQNISWPVDMTMQMSELMMSSPHYLPYILYIKFWEI